MFLFMFIFSFLFKFMFMLCLCFCLHAYDCVTKQTKYRKNLYYFFYYDQNI